ncbi:putative ATP-dependent DNA helicase [Vibrio phage phiKT1028]|nr:putative ATP-dependent DNA helicase [Vibrio phage phiKT1028]
MGAPLEFNLEQQEQVLKYLKIQSEILPKQMVDDPSDDVPERSWEELLQSHWEEDSLKSIKTVRFLKDFQRYKARPDLKTSNKSFIRTMEVFRKMGIKNCAFHLQLNNPALVGVDPRDPNLTDDQRLMIMKEMKENFWYFLREVCHLNGGIRFRANRANISFAWCWLNHLTTMLILPRQQGKELSVDAKVKTPEGWKRNGDLVKGDLLTMPDGTHRRVKGVYHQGVKHLYEVTFEDDRSVKAGAEHLWKVFNEKTRSWHVMSTHEMVDELCRDVQLSIPLVAPDQGPEIDLPVNPWLMGVIHSEGGMTASLLKLRGEDHYVEYKAKRLIEKHEGSLVAGKTIPEIYFRASYRQRLQVVQGLMDVNGSASPAGTIVWKGHNQALMEQMKMLLRSVGAVCEVIDEKRFCLRIKFHAPTTLFSSPSKQSRIPEGFVNTRLGLKDIEPVGKEEAVCIEVDHPDHLYITNDFIVTHNTVTAQCIFFWLTYISGRAYESHLITLKDDNRQQFVDAIKGIRNNIPAWMTNVTYRDKDAGNSLTYSAFGDEVKNKLTISVPQIGQEAARNVGRGLTIKSRFIDEPAYIKWMEEILNGAGPSTLTARENARRLDEPYATGFITTPASILTESGAYMYNILMESTEWRENYFDTYSESHLYDVLLKNAPKATTSPSVGMVFNYLQLGKNRDWVKKTIDELKLSLSEAKIDLLLMWDDNGKGKLFDDETRDALNDAKRGRSWSQQIAGTSLYFDWFISPEEHAEIMSGQKRSTFYLIGLDTSGAVGRDACTIVVRDIRDGSVAGVGRYQRAFLTEVGMVVQTLLTELPDSLLIPERNYAHHMIDQLLQSLPAMGLDPFKKIYNRIFQDPVKYQNHYRDIKARSFGNRNDVFYLKYKEFFGFNTGAKSRETMYGFLEEAVSLTGSGTRYTKLIDELTNLKLKNGRIDHDTGAHDDIVISWLLTYWFIKLGENKNEYEIPNNISLSNVDMLRLGEAKKELSDPVQQKRTAFYKQKIEEVSAKLLETDDPIIAARLEVALDRLHAMIPNEVRKSITIDDIKRKAEEERNKRILENKQSRFRRR